MSKLVVGIGSPIRSDDGVGLHVIRALRERRLPAAVELLELGTAGLTLLDHLPACEQLLVVDAMVSGAAPGTVRRLSTEEVTRTVHLGADHDADLPTALRLGRELLGARMPEQVHIVAVEAADITSFSELLTPAVRAAVPAAVEEVCRLLEGEPTQTDQG